VGAPTNDNDAATKKYVDTAINNKSVNATITYDNDGRLTQIVDGSITTNVSRVDYDSQQKVYIQNVGESKKTTITYNSDGKVVSIIDT
jgi:YD repeat-containing protein